MFRLKLIIISYFLVSTLILQAQTMECIPNSSEVVDTPYIGEIFLNNGSVNNALNNRYSLTGSVGDLFIGDIYGQDFQGGAGFYSSFLLPPSPPIVTATQGDLLDRIQLNWELDPLSPPVSEGFNIYRDGIFLAEVASGIRTYNDFNVISGRTYNYVVRGVNTFGEGYEGKALGFQVPNGVVTGWVRTPSGNPVPNAVIQLTPMQGFGLEFGPMSAAIADTSNTSFNSFFPIAGNEWSVSFWIKTNTSNGEANIIEFAPSNLQFLGVPSNSGTDGVILSLDGSTNLQVDFSIESRNDWHHIVATFDGLNYRLYLDGQLSNIGIAPTIGNISSLKFGKHDLSGEWEGKIDEFRIYNRALDELDFDEIMNGTASSLTPNLLHYWKFDEGEGEKSFDILNRSKLYFCGATFSVDRAPVKTSAVTNEEGYYRIESASYGTGTTFLAKASKNFYSERALRFDSSEEDKVILPDFSLPGQSTMELWLNRLGEESIGTLLAKAWGSNSLILQVGANGGPHNLELIMNGSSISTPISSFEFQHIAITIDSSGNSKTVDLYINGNLATSGVFNNTSGNFSDAINEWYLGIEQFGIQGNNPYDGIITEIAFYEGLLDQSTIQSHVDNKRDPQETGLLYYFPFNEGSGVNLNNIGSVLTPKGEVVGAEWVPFAPNQIITPHEFSPETRQVTLNPSVTSVDQVDFIDRSVIPISGFVRYENTDCFANNVEILFNGESYDPPIFTDSTGAFTIDLDPGTSGVLTPVLSDHAFAPASYEVINVNSPIAGILFTDQTKRTISGQLSGGSCKKSIIKFPAGQGQGTFARVKVSTTDGCLEREYLFDNQEGIYQFDNLPPVENMVVSIVEHSDPEIKSFFQVSGGVNVDLTDKDSTGLDFTYFAEPEVQIVSGLDPVSPECSTILLDQGEMKTVNLRVVEQYEEILDINMSILDDGLCVLDTASLEIINGFSNETIDTSYSGTNFQYEFVVGGPNPSPPYIKNLQVIGINPSGRKGSISVPAVVTGIFNKESTFTTQLPEFPMLVLRDPPGDQSYSYWQKDNKVCSVVKSFLSVETGGSASSEIKGPKVKIVAAPLGVGLINETEINFGAGISATATYKIIEEDRMEICMSASEKISTSDQSTFIGSQADVFVGLGANLSVGFADEVLFDAETCLVSTDTIITIEPLNATTFSYTRNHIENNIIRYLEDIINNTNLNLTPEELDRYVLSKSNWESMIAYNDSIKENTPLIDNRSFDAGAIYSYSVTSDTSYNESNSEFFNGTLNNKVFLGVTVNGVGLKGELNFTNSVSRGISLTEGGYQNGITTGYVLSDDDRGDAISVDIGMDTTFGTPVFNLVAGQTSCPWEPNTANREGPNLQLAPGANAKQINVPSHEAAVFNLVLGNLSATNEDWTYGFKMIEDSNPDGAIIKLNGAVLASTRRFTVPYGSSIPITITIERGPVAYEYDSLRVAFFSECDYEANLAAGNPVDRDPKFFSSLSLGVDFIRPCSEVSINVPEQNFAVINNDVNQPGTIRRITVSDYDLLSPEFQLVRVQYRKSNGDGAWININTSDGIFERYNPNHPDADGKTNLLQPGFTQFFWETAGLEDGDYEIHAWAVCTGDASDKPGFSEIIKGRIDRQPPQLLGTPQPADGAYHVGDEISFTFNKYINCDDLIEADMTQPNNVGLYDATTGKVLNIDIGCYENKIILEPVDLNSEFENHILRAELHDIEDLVGNTLVFEKWEFYVDRNELTWLTDSAGMTKTEGEIKTVTAKVMNRSGYPVPFEITSAPEWVHIYPNKGTIVPNEIREINFEVDNGLAFGSWSDTIVLTTSAGLNPNFFMGGDEPLPFGVRVICEPPAWDFDPGQYPNSMNFVLELDIEGQISDDEEDIVAAFINDQLHGLAKVKYEKNLDRYLAFISVYGNENHFGQTIRFEIWDASACLRYGEITPTFTFQSDMIIGTPNAPQVIFTTSQIRRDIPIENGWNWLSFNLDFPDNSLNAALSLIDHPDGDLIRAFNGNFAQNLGNQWFGPLLNLDETKMYVYRSTGKDTLTMLGTVLDPGVVSIPVTPGWNWIGYIPNYALGINDALSTLSPSSGDIIKSQYGFAQYVGPSFGWVGNLDYMTPLEGYQINLTNPGLITYPPRPSGLTEEYFTTIRQNPFNYHWKVEKNEFESNMTVIGTFQSDGMEEMTDQLELAAFFGDKVIGVSEPTLVEANKTYRFFLTVSGSTQMNNIDFKIYDHGKQEVINLDNQMVYIPNLHQGTINDPVVFRKGESKDNIGILVDDQKIKLFPNPTANKLNIDLGGSFDGLEFSITISNVIGEKVRVLSDLKEQDQVELQLESLENGLYNVLIQSDEKQIVKKFVKIK